MPLARSTQQVLNEWLDSRLNELHVAMPGKFKSYDAAKQTAEVVPVVMQSLLAGDGSLTEVELPVIPNVRVQWPRTSKGYLHFPIAVGDFCQLIFNEAAIGFWRENGELASAGDLERHGISHPYAYPGGWPDGSPLPDAPGGYAVLIVAPKLRVSTASGTAAPVANGTKADTELSALKTMLTTFASACALAAIEPALAPAATALQTALGSWPSGSVKTTTLEAE
jgi:Phage protein Gp138 N-terminal domain